ncbi:MAG: hypothetical protein K2J12_08025 [Muribaculaceae bacterium]|nr:hypothetical protein [Muribaculaceae bacterium]
MKNRREGILLFEKYVLQHKKIEKYLEGNEKVCNFALAFENEGAQRRDGRESKKEASKVKCG